ncbi:MAG TPA: hypothetical protein VND93_18025 [Myxococcales bacterium]|jgi:hypothetical protein|nr:hypothetical protein [Myxococcales bacterium]
MKVQSQPQQAQASQAQTQVQSAGNKPATSTTPAQQGAQFKDEFVQGNKGDKKGIIDCFPPFPKPQDTLSLQDHLTASRLPETLSNPLDKPLLAAGNKDQALSRDDKGVMRGPEGQPLAKVQLKDGTTAYVDANTNKYYLTDQRERFGRVNALGPLDLPEGSKFSNSYFSDADARSIERAAQGGNVWPFPRPPIDPLPLPPRPFPFPIDPGPFKPLPLPQPIPFDPGGPIFKKDPGVLLESAAGKASGLE